MNKKAAAGIATAVLAVVIAVICTQVTIFVIQPIGAIPDGKTLIISRLGSTHFVDSADAMCDRQEGGVSLLCRMVALGAVVKNTTVYARLPYSHWLYSISTGGKNFEN